MATKPRDSNDPRMPAIWENPDAVAIKALVRGEASAEQQQRAVAFIINTIAKTYDMSYRQNPYDTAFAEGMRFVGNQIVKLININLASLKRG